MFFIFGWQSQFAPSLLALYWIHRKLIVVLIDIMTNEIATKKYDGTSLWSNAKKIASIRLVAFLPSHHFTLINSEHIFCTFLCRFCAIRYSISIKWFFSETYFVFEWIVCSIQSIKNKLSIDRILNDKNWKCFLITFIGKNWHSYRMNHVYWRRNFSFPLWMQISNHQFCMHNNREIRFSLRFWCV